MPRIWSRRANGATLTNSYDCSPPPALTDRLLAQWTAGRRMIGRQAQSGIIRRAGAFFCMTAIGKERRSGAGSKVVGRFRSA